MLKTDLQMYQKARLSRDARFDGRFFIAVKTTGIYCRPICPANTPKEENLEYFKHAFLAAKAGYRPCLRCHPDSAPSSPVWNGVHTTLSRAKRLIDNGALEQGSLLDLSAKLGISDRYLRQLFRRYLGVSAKSYALFRQCEFAKNLLHQTSLPMTQIAFAAGFKSIRRFNDCFKKQLSLSPSELRRSKTKVNSVLNLKFYYRPPYNWQYVQQFFMLRHIKGMEWTTAETYGRTFRWSNNQGKCKGRFTATHNEMRHRFDIQLEIDNVLLLKPVVNTIRRILDLDTDSEIIETTLLASGFENITKGLRLPGVWSLYEAGIRAILGQQISVLAGHKLVAEVLCQLGEKTSEQQFYFPSPEAMATSNFDFLRIPQKRKQTLINLAEHFLVHANSEDPNSWLALKGIGPWTINYAKMRGLSEPDIYLGGDLVVKKALKASPVTINPDNCTPFRSYLTLQLWNKLNENKS